MKVPFTVTQFLDVFREYNEAIFPLQLLFYLLAFLAVYLIFKAEPMAHKTISIILSFFWFWMGVGYHLIYFTKINPAAYLFAVFFITQGILFLAYGFFGSRLVFKPRFDARGITGVLFIFFALFVYPVLSYLSDHRYPSAPTFGLPCPTTIYTFGLLLMTEKKIPVIVLIIPFLWSLLGFTAAFQFGIIEDTGLLIAGLLSFGLLVFRKEPVPDDKALA